MRRLAALIGCAVLLAAGPAAAEIIDRVVAVVNDEVVTLSEVEDAAAGALREAEAETDPVARQQKRQRQLRAFLDLIIGDKLVKQEAAKARIVVREPEVDAHLERVMKQQGWGEPQLQQYLLAQGLTLATFKEQVRDQLLQRKVVGRFLRDKITLSDRDVLNYCREKTTEAASSYAVDAAHIVLRVPEGATAAEDAALRRKAEEIRDRAKAGEDFAALAKQYSDIGGDNGGALGTVNKGDLDPTLEKAIFSLPEGGVGGPVRSPAGYHVVRSIQRVKKAASACEEVDPEMRNALYQERLRDAMADWIGDLRKKAFIEVRL